MTPGRLRVPCRFPVLLAAAGILFFLAGCAGFLGSRGPLPPEDPRRLIRRVRQHAARLETFEGYARFTAVTEFGALRGTLTIRARNPDTLWVKVEGPMGISFGMARLAGPDILMYHPMAKTVYRGTLMNPGLRHALPLNVLTENLVLAVQGLPMIDTAVADSAGVVSVSDREYTLTAGRGDLIRILPEGPVVREWVCMDSLGQTVWSFQGSRHRKAGRVRLPRMVQLTQTRPPQQMTLYYDFVKTNVRLREGWSDIRFPEDADIHEF
ncbi:MAG TPA: hypothetical protein ENN17_07340 [bacterium]|nr:hypothetical protein [bacterium]